VLHIVAISSNGFPGGSYETNRAPSLKGVSGENRNSLGGAEQPDKQKNNIGKTPQNRTFHFLLVIFLFPINCPIRIVSLQVAFDMLHLHTYGPTLYFS
jgi:hypothetical protein